MWSIMHVGHVLSPIEYLTIFNSHSKTRLGRKLGELIELLAGVRVRGIAIAALKKLAP